MSKLLSPVTIGTLVLKNRVVLAPLTRARADPPSRVPNDLIKTYYEQRSNAGLIISEGVGISVQGFGWFGAPALYTEEHAEGWKKITDAVHAKDSKIFAQLWHMGRQSHPTFNPANEVVAPSAIRVQTDVFTRDASGNRVPYATPRALETSEIPGIVQDYQNSAKLAKLAGFDGVELHSANGYLLDEFLQSTTNHRADAYGGCVENRYRLLKEVVEAVGQVFPYDRIGVRISPNGVYGDMGSADNHSTFSYIAEQLSTYGLAYLHVMDGLGFGFHGKDQVMSLFDAKLRFRGPVMGNVDFTKDVAEGALRSGAADLIAFGRAYISNPDLVERFTNDWPLTGPAPREVWWSGGGSTGYTDYPNYTPSEIELNK